MHILNCKTHRYRFMALISVLAIVLSLGACDGTQTEMSYKPSDIANLDNTVVCENDNYILRWDNINKAVLLENKNTGFVWSTVPFDFLDGEETNINLNSPVFIEYYTPEDGSLQILKAYSSCIEEEMLSVSLTDNTLKLIFNFKDAEISFALDFKLRSDSLQVSLPFKEIKESGKTQLVSVSILPYFCSLKNTDDKSSYLFVPSGSGALMYADEEIQNVSRDYSGSVYGNDAAQVRLDNPSEEEPIRIPVYGVTSGENSLMAIIENEEGSGIIEAQAGNSRNGYSTVYTTLRVRGGDETEAQRNNYKDEVIYSEDYNKEAVFSVGYYPLFGKESGYVGMAKKYRDYLLNEAGIENKKPNQKNFEIKIIGGAVIKKFFVGFPYHTFQSTTTVNEAVNIIGELSKDSDSIPSVTLVGFGESGVDVGKLGGGFSLENSLGNKEDWNKLKSLCKEKNIPIYMDFDVVNFTKSSNGFSTVFDSAKTAERQSAKIYKLNLGLRTNNTDSTAIRLLSRKKLNDAVEKAQNLVQINNLGISLSTLSNTAYSDYSDEKYFIKGNTKEQVFQIVKQIKEKEISVAGSSANSYMAVFADKVSDVPLDNGKYRNLDDSVPFYSLVFGSIDALYSQPLNLADNPREMLLKAIEAGVAPSFTLTNNYDEKLSDSFYQSFYGTGFEGQKEKIKNILSETNAYYSKISDQHIISHKIIMDGVTKTVFSKGTTVIVNTNDYAVEYETDMLEPLSFSYSN